MAIAVQTLTVALRGAQHPFPVVSLVDRRKTPARRKQFGLTRGIERLLYGVTSKSTGAWAAHLDKHDLVWRTQCWSRTRPPSKRACSCRPNSTPVSAIQPAVECP